MTIEWHQLLLYMAAYTVMVVSPGPFMAAIVARSAAFGFATGASLALGGWLAEKIWIFCAIFGLAVIANQYADLLLILKLVGAGWLIYLGLKLIFGSTGMIDAEVAPRNEPFWRGMATGFLINIGNPKAALFFIVLFPGFFDMTRVGWIDALVIVAVSMPIGAASDLGYAWLADRARRLLKNRRTAQRIDRATGGVLAGAGVAIAAS